MCRNIFLYSGARYTRYLEDILKLYTKRALKILFAEFPNLKQYLVHRYDAKLVSKVCGPCLISSCLSHTVTSISCQLLQHRCNHKTQSRFRWTYSASFGLQTKLISAL